MARDRNETTPADEQIADAAASAPATPATEAAATATPAEPKVDDRFKMVPRPGTGELVKRKEYITELWTGAKTSNNPEGIKYTRGQIAAHLTEITGKKVPYQIVFAAVKGVEGGPPKAAVAIPSSIPATPPAE